MSKQVIQVQEPDEPDISFEREDERPPPMRESANKKLNQRQIDQRDGNSEETIQRNQLTKEKKKNKESHVEISNDGKYQINAP